MQTTGDYMHLRLLLTVPLVQRLVVTPADAACGNGTNGTVNVGAVTGGPAPYAYSVDGSAFTATLVYSNLAAGSHAVK